MESYINELKSMTLYGALRETDTLNDVLQKKVDLFNHDLSKFVELSGYEDISIEQIPQLDIPEIQRELIETHRSNLYLNQVLEGKNSFVNIVTELYNRTQKGWKSWFPIRKDEEYNKEIKELDEILKTGLEISFSKEITKPVSFSVICGLVSSAAYMPLTLSSGKFYFVPVIGSIFVASLGFWLGAHGPHTPSKKGLQNKAEYLDKKVEDLMK